MTIWGSEWIFNQMKIINLELGLVIIPCRTEKWYDALSARLEKKSYVRALGQGQGLQSLKQNVLRSTALLNKHDKCTIK